ncbi:MAG: DNA mismatch endonuclease Vsr, partial [Lentisphaerae bacterium]|nr:DNA mismatch endonuclease Vsr [Lentisphaerota bacterium]
MTDTLSKAERSRNMAQIRGKDTGPERLVRSLLHRAGYRFRLHVKDLPGKPDIVLPRYGTVIFVHGCFWHRHPGCKGATTPKTHRKFWAD